MPNRSLHILLIENNSSDAVLLTKELMESPFGPFFITHVKRLKEALGRLLVKRFDAILFDLGVPDNQGITSLEGLRRQTPHEIPIVVFIGLDDEPQRLCALKAGANDCLAKHGSASSMRARAVRHAIERKRASEACLESQRQLGMAVDAANLGIFDWNLKTGRIAWSFHHARLFGLSPGEYDETFAAFERLVHPDDRAGTNAAIDRSLKSHEEYLHQYRVIWPDASEHWIEGRGKVFRDDQETPVRMMGTVMDISQRKAGEETAATRDFELARFASAHLTARERTLLKLIAAGLPSKRIAIDMNISIRTVAKHRSNLMTKTKALNAADLARMSTLAGVLPTP